MQPKAKQNLLCTHKKTFNTDDPTLAFQIWPRLYINHVPGRHQQFCAAALSRSIHQSSIPADHRVHQNPHKTENKKRNAGALLG